MSGIEGDLERKAEQAAEEKFGGGRVARRQAASSKQAALAISNKQAETPTPPRIRTTSSRSALPS